MKLPSREEISQMDTDYQESDGGDRKTIIYMRYPEFTEVFDFWNECTRIERRGDMEFFEDFFSWYELSQTPLMKALDEKV